MGYPITVALRYLASKKNNMISVSTATIANAGVVAELPGGLLSYVEGFAPAKQLRAPRKLSEIRSQSPESVAIAKDLRRRGARFVGPTTLYALMQASGLVNDHLIGCFRRREVQALTRDR